MLKASSKCTKPLCNFSNTLWFRIGDIIFGIVYVPPEGSKYTDHEAFESLSNIILELMEHLECPNVCLIGDFNARTGRLDDFVVIDDKVMDCNIVIPNEAKDCLSLPNYEIDQLRSSSDTKTNNYGKCLINFCQNIDVRIVNGRFGVYSSLATCRDASVVDYFIMSPELFNSVISMKVRNFDPLFSDVHNVIELHIHPSFLHSVNNELVIHDDITVNDENVIPFKYCWSQDKAEDYVCNIDRIKMSELVLELDKCLANHEYVNDVQIDTLNKNLCDLFSDAAANSDMVKLCGQHKNRNMHDKGKAKKQKWFDSNCKISRKAYHKAKHNYNVCKSSNNKELLRLSSKKYKNALRNAVRKYEKGFNKKLRSLKSANPK